MEATEQTPTGGEGTAPAPAAQESDTNAGTLLTSAESNEGKQQAEPQEGGDGGAGEAGAEGQTEGEEGAEKEEGEGEKQGAPEKYEDFKMPEGTELDAEVGAAFQGVAKELNLSQEQAQGFLDKMAPVLQKRSADRIAAISNEWMEQSKADKEFGGQKLMQSLSDIARLRDTFARNADGSIDADIQEFLSSPMGNHPGALRLLSRIGRAFGEAKYPGGGSAEDGRYTAEQFYQDAMKGGK
jgi:hypothetical protein|nr:MAG TPA: putative protease [Caudoviricetes sp.]